MRQIEHAKRLSHYLISNEVVSAVHARTGQSANGRDVGRRQKLAVIHSCERQQLVLLERKVHVYAQFHVFFADEVQAKAKLHTAVAHAADVGQQLVIGEGRHANVVVVQHVCGFRVVVFGVNVYAVAEKSCLHTHIKRCARFPFQVGIDVAQLSQGNGGAAVMGHNAVGHQHLQGVISHYSAQVSRAANTGSQFKLVEPMHAFQPFFFLNVPFQARRGEVTPRVVLANKRRAIGAERQRKGVTPQKRVRKATHERG